MPVVVMAALRCAQISGLLYTELNWGGEEQSTNMERMKEREQKKQT
jgi:hypothetical protein